MPIASITLKMVFVLAWTIGDASLASQLLNQVHFVYSSMSSGVSTRSKFNSVIKCGTTERLAMEQAPRTFGFMPLLSVALRCDASFFFCTY